MTRTIANTKSRLRIIILYLSLKMCKRKSYFLFIDNYLSPRRSKYPPNKLAYINELFNYQSQDSAKHLISLIYSVDCQ